MVIHLSTFSCRNRIRMYPAFVNCTTIDWFSEWPADALLEVADKYLNEITLGSEEEVVFFRLLSLICCSLYSSLLYFIIIYFHDPFFKYFHDKSFCVQFQDKLKPSLAKMFSVMHKSVTEYSKRMLIELRRHNYVTPTNYLELVSGYKK